MSKSYRDKRSHKARNPEKYFNENLPLICMGKDYESVDWGEVLFKNNIYPTKKFPKIAWSIQGKRRRGSTRKGNQKVKQMISQLDRAKNKTNLIKEIKQLEDEK